VFHLDNNLTMAKRRKEIINPQRYEVLQGLSYGDARAEVGDVVTDLPADSLPWLLEQEAIRPIEDESEAT
jgi:hypothetical protein